MQISPNISVYYEMRQPYCFMRAVACSSYVRWGKKCDYVNNHKSRGTNPRLCGPVYSLCNVAGDLDKPDNLKVSVRRCSGNAVTVFATFVARTHAALTGKLYHYS